MPLRSTYAHLLTLPAHLAAGDKAGAAAVHRQLLALLERGGWTAAESGRLRKMEKDWRRRLAGEDAKFNVAGWARQGTGHHTSRTVAELDKIRRRIQDGNWEDAE
jgi:hypothetical protein